MLVTTCKYCGARFRVTPDQLNLRQGQVRCGECLQVFNGFEALERFPGDDTGTRLLASRAGSPKQPDILGELADIDLGTRLEPGKAPAAAPAGPAPPALPAVHAETESFPAAPAREASATPAEPPAAPRPATQAFEDYAPAAPEPPSRAWAFGVVFLSLVLALQLAYAFRAKLAQQYPAARPVLESVCAAAGCTVPWVNDEAALKLEDSELLEVPGKPGQISLQARIRNLSTTAQEFPHLELTLTDITGQTAIRRVLRPADYLGRPPVSGEAMAPGSEALVSIRLETGRIKPTGYELLLFYP